MAGTPVNALNRPGAAVITEDIAFKYIGVEEPLGKTIQIESKEYEITGINTSGCSTGSPKI